MILAMLIAALLFASPAAAQTSERFSIDSVLAADVFRGENASDRPDLVVDISAVARLGGGWTAYIRPWFLQPKTTTWNKEIYQAALQYARTGPVATRLDIGYIASPFGLGMLDMRSSVNPTIMPHLSYFVPLTPFATGPTVGAIAASYPLGAQATASTEHWDARAAVLNSTPTRIFVINGARNPAHTPAVVVGGGVTPKTGLRLGASAAYGDYATASELPSGSNGYESTNEYQAPTTIAGAGRSVVMLAFEGEYAFRYTRMSGEFIRDRFDTPTGSEPASAWYVQGMQTLSPRWFVAARHEGMSAPPLIASPSSMRPSFLVNEATVGYRLTSELTLRASALGMRPYMTTDWNRQAGVSVVWAHRWW